MTTATATATPSAAPRRSAVGPGTQLSFLRILRSEWIKFVTVRSTVWSVAVTLLVMVGVSLMMGFGMVAFATSENAGEMPPEAGPGMDAGTGVMVGSFGYTFGQIVVAVLGVLIISGEYSTGQIKSTLAAVPTRLPVLWAKAIIVAVTSFVVGALGTALAVLVTTPMLEPHGMAADLSDPDAIQRLLGVPLYLMAVALLALAVGALLRHSAGGISTVLGVLLVLPILGQIQLDWIQDIAPYLPSTAGERIITGAATGDVLTPWQGYGVLGLWVVVAMALAAVLLRRRDA